MATFKYLEREDLKESILYDTLEKLEDDSVLENFLSLAGTDTVLYDIRKRLINAFRWRTSPQGHPYWNSVYMRTIQLR